MRTRYDTTYVLVTYLVSDLLLGFFLRLLFRLFLGFLLRLLRFLLLLGLALQYELAPDVN